MEAVDCGKCYGTTSEYLEFDETLVCGACIKGALNQVECCLCFFPTGIFMNVPEHKHPEVYCITCINELEKAREAEIERDFSSSPSPPPTSPPPNNKKQKK
jgi:hypothetical protein